MIFASIAARLRSRGTAFGHDLLMIPAAWLGALWLRFNLGVIPEEILAQAFRLLPVIVVVQGSVFLYFGLYRGVWRFASVPDLVRIIQAVVVGVALCALAVFLLTRMSDVPRASFPLFAGLLVAFLSGPRLAYRWLRDRERSPAHSRRTLIVGAGAVGEMLVRELRRDRNSGYLPVGFVDDAPAKRGRDVHGVRVLGPCSRIPEIVARTRAEVVAIAIPAASAAEMRRIVELCERSNVPIRTVPRLKDVVSGRIAASELREVAVEDLLDRKPVELDWSAMRGELAGRRILVTGGGGSIGSELCRQIARLAPARLVIVDISELNLHRIQLELSDAHPALVCSMVLADVCDEAAIERVFERYRPEVVFHAAAYKQVPILESHLREAVRVNALGTQTAARAAARHSAGRFVLVSSDKAVDPANAMGASKRLAETICRAVDDASPSTRLIAVRFGNVLDSAGSVVPLFREQIARGGPVTVTDPKMERYFMTIPEACQLVMASAALGRGGEVFVLDMGEPVRILYLAEQMIRLSGKVPGEDIAIEFIGSRPGEKLSEALFHPSESLDSTDHDKILLVRGESAERSRLSDRLAELREACDAFDEERLEALLVELVPGYRSGLWAHLAAVQDEPRGSGPRPAPAGGGERDEAAAGNVVRLGPRRH